MKAWFRDIIIACIIAFAVMQFVKPTIVKESSMQPTLYENNYIFLSKQAYKFSSPKRGDIIVFHTALKTQDGQEKLLIKRVIGLPGDVISVAEGHVYLNDDLLEEPYLLEEDTPGAIESARVPEGELFVMGDNRRVSVDSRSETVGFVPIEEVVGKAFFRLYPFDEITTL